MKLPADYPLIVASAVAVLHAVSKEVRAEAARQPDAPELWLVVRDLDGLADRVAGQSDWEWENGFGAMFIAGQDFGALDELLTMGVPLRETTIVSLTPDQAASLARLRTFLHNYAHRLYDSDEPAA
jgi:hypothetical protein